MSSISANQHTIVISGSDLKIEIKKYTSGGSMETVTGFSNGQKNEAGQGEAGQGEAGQGEAGQGEAGQGEAGQGEEAPAQEYIPLPEGTEFGPPGQGPGQGEPVGNPPGGVVGGAGAPAPAPEAGAGGNEQQGQQQGPVFSGNFQNNGTPYPSPLDTNGNIIPGPPGWDSQGNAIDNNGNKIGGPNYTAWIAELKSDAGIKSIRRKRIIIR